MSIWKQKFSLEGINGLSTGNMGAHLGIHFFAFGPDKIWASMPVDQRTKQPMGLLHGGASAALAETMGSVASTLCIANLNKQSAVGIEINYRCQTTKSMHYTFKYNDCLSKMIQFQ